MIKKINRYLSQVQQLLALISEDQIALLVEILLEANRSRRQIFVMGNGGSAATASHFACDLGKGVIVPNTPRFRVHALTDNVPLMTAWANDSDYENIFAEQLSNLVQKGDVVIAISGSGNSPNVLKAIRLARMRSAYTVGICGFDGGQLKGMVDHAIHVPSNFMEQVEDVHMVLTHLVCSTVREMLHDQRAFGFLPDASGARTLDNLTDHLISVLDMTICSLMLLEPAKEHVVIRALSAARYLPSTPQVGQQIALEEAPFIRSVVEGGVPLLFQQSEPSLALPARELQVASGEEFMSGVLLPIHLEDEVIGTVLLGEMRSWNRRPQTPENIVRGLEIIEEWTPTIQAHSTRKTIPFSLQERAS